MFTYRVEDMSCAHCVRTLREAVLALDPAAQVEADLATHQLTVQTQRVDSRRIAEALALAGYPTVALP